MPTTSSRRYNSKPMVFDLDIANPPPSLTLLINPSNLEMKYTPKLTEQRVRWAGTSPGYIFHVHHDELDVLTASGKSAMFMADDEGLTRINRTETLAYQNIESLVTFYRNNGTNLNPKSNSTINPCMVNSMGRVRITYNGYSYKGHFISLTITENDSSPFNVDFSFEFKVTRTFDVGQVSSSFQPNFTPLSAQ
jgi:hypothetical protein